MEFKTLGANAPSRVGRSVNAKRKDFSRAGDGVMLVPCHQGSDKLSDSSLTTDPTVFAATHWSVVLAAGHSSMPGAQVALEKLCRTYWFPLYAFARRQGNSPEDAQDLTQGFFSRLLEKNYLAKADPGRGKFRTFLLRSLKNFLINEWKRTERLKRGGGSVKSQQGVLASGFDRQDFGKLLAHVPHG